MQLKGRLTHSPKAGKPCLGIGPEALYSIDMASISDEFVLTVVDSKMLFISEIDQPVVAPPTIGMDDAFKADTASDDCLERSSFAVGHDFGVNFSVPSEHTENNGFSKSPTSPFSLYSLGSEVTFINFNFPVKRGLPEAIRSNSSTDFLEIAIDGISVEAGNFGDLGGVQPIRKEPDQFPDFLL